jgi:hypothetical protein
MHNTEMTIEERQLMDLAGSVMVEFNKLPEQHSADKKDVCFHVNAIQNIILSRVGLRVYQNAVSKDKSDGGL